MYYFLDLRSNPDTTLDPIVLKNQDTVSPWVFNTFTQHLLQITKGLIVFTDSVSSVAPYLLSKSITGLCDTDLEEFLHASCVTKIGSKKIEYDTNSKSNLKGYISGEKWTRLALL